MKISKKYWMQLHTYLSLFFLPAAIIYAITGALYIFNIKENALANIYTYQIDSMPKQGEEAQTIIAMLQKYNHAIPSNTEVRISSGNVFMGNIKYRAEIIKESDDTCIFRVTNRSLYGVLLLMHKSKGKYYFDIIAISFTISLMLFYLSGLIVTSFAKKNRKVAINVLISGFIITSLAVYFSI